MMLDFFLKPFKPKVSNKTSEQFIISLHIPKTAGRSFYHILEQVYGESLSISYKRKDVLKALQDFPTMNAAIDPNISVIHGHFYYKELQKVHKKRNAQVICWLRNPVDRVISNYLFFKRGLQNPSRNPDNYAKNKHRIAETLLEYAEKEENRNRMSKFLDGIHLNDLLFVGLQEFFDEDIKRLSELLDWPEISIPVINKNPNPLLQESVSQTDRQKIKAFNSLDDDLFQLAMKNRV